MPTKKADSLKSLPFEMSEPTALRWKRGLIDVDAASVFVKTNTTRHQGEEGVVLAHADIATCHPLGSALADEDVACDDGLVAVFLHTKALALAVATVLNASLTFLMSHKMSFLKVMGLTVDRDDLNAGEVLTMTTGEVVSFALLEFEGGDFRCAMLFHHFGDDCRATHGWGTDLNLGSLTMGEHLIKRSPLTFIDGEFFDVDFVSNGDFVLLAAGLENCVCHNDVL